MLHPALALLAAGLIWAGIGLHLRQDYLAGGGLLTVLVLIAGRSLHGQRARLLAGRAALTGTLENISQGILMVDARGDVAVLNSRAIELLGLPREFAHSRPSFRDILSWQLENGEFGPPGSVDPQFLEHVLAGGLTEQFSIYERMRADGTVLEIRTQKLPDGSAVRTYTDITARRANADALTTARDAALAAGRARNEFLAVMSHEIRTPMNGIIGVAGLLLESRLGPTEAHYGQIILESGNHLLRLLDDILDFSSLDAGRVDLNDAAFDLRDMARNAVDALAAEAEAKSLDLSLVVAEDVPRQVAGDSRRLRQVLVNLVGNAVKFTGHGSVRVAVARLPGEPQFPGGPDVVRLGFSVGDTGIGIPPDALGQLFTGFTQVDGSISRRFGGSGLGLAISRRLVERMGGTIEIDSTPGVGSVLRFDVLLARAPQTGDAGTSEAEPPVEAGESGCGIRVLVAEDNPTNRLVATRMLERLGHRVDSVVNGLDAVEAVRTTPYDLVLMDIMMPEMDGLAATSTIRALPGPRARIPIIGLTANAMRAGEAACLASGMDHFATKPISANRLADAIGLVLASRAPTIRNSPVRALEVCALDTG